MRTRIFYLFVCLFFAMGQVLAQDGGTGTDGTDTGDGTGTNDDNTPVAAPITATLHNNNNQAGGKGGKVLELTIPNPATTTLAQWLNAQQLDAYGNPKTTCDQTTKTNVSLYNCDYFTATGSDKVQRVIVNGGHVAGTKIVWSDPLPEWEVETEYVMERVQDTNADGSPKFEADGVTPVWKQEKVQDTNADGSLKFKVDGVTPVWKQATDDQGNLLWEDDDKMIPVYVYQDVWQKKQKKDQWDNPITEWKDGQQVPVWETRELTNDDGTPKYKLDAEGNKIPKKNQWGNIIYQKDAQGNTIYQTSTEVAIVAGGATATLTDADFQTLCSTADEICLDLYNCELPESAYTFADSDTQHTGAPTGLTFPTASKFRSLILPENLGFTEVKEEWFQNCNAKFHTAATIRKADPVAGTETYVDCYNKVAGSMMYDMFCNFITDADQGQDELQGLFGSGGKDFYVENIKISGSVKTEDLASEGITTDGYEENNWYGSCENDASGRKLKHLDLGNALLEGKNVPEMGNLKGLETIIFTKNLDHVPDNFMSDLKNLKEVHLPEKTLNADGTVLYSGVKSIGASAFADCNNLTTVSMGNAKSIGASAFKGTDLNPVILPDELETIGSNAFVLGSQDERESLVLPKGLKSIASNAFLNMNFKDVYFLYDGTGDVPTVADDAFTENMLSGNGSVDKSAFVLLKDGEYIDSQHFPTLTVTDAQGNQRSMGFGAISSSDEALYIQALKDNGYQLCSERANYHTGTLWTSKLHLSAALLDPDNLDKLTKLTDPNRTYSCNDRNTNGQIKWPTENEVKTIYNNAKDGKNQNGTAMANGAMKGTYKFALVSFDVKQSDTREWDFGQGKYTDGMWWTICVPFNMTKAQVSDVFGEKTELCQLKEVIRNEETTTNGSTTHVTRHIQLNFTDEKCYNVTDPDEIVLQAHQPYMIYPYTNDSVVAARAKRILKGYSVIGGGPQKQTVTSTSDEGKTPTGENNATRKYTFRGNYQEWANTNEALTSTASSNSAGTNSGITKEPVYRMPYTYFLTKKSATENSRIIAFQRTANAGKWTAYTAIVMHDSPEQGKRDLEEYFTNGTSSSAPTNSKLGAMSDDMSTTGIEQVDIIVGKDHKTAHGVYTLKGEFLGLSTDSATLPKGVYVIDGRKVVRK